MARDTNILCDGLAMALNMTNGSLDPLLPIVECSMFGLGKVTQA